MASNRAIMLRGTVASHQLPDDVEGHADTRSATARAAATAGFCCSSWPHFPSGDGLNSYTGFAVWASKAVRGTKSFAESAEFSGVNGPYELEGWNLKLKLIRGDPAYPGTRGAEYPRTARLLHPISRHKHNLVPEGDDRPALLLLRLGRSLNEVTPRG
jgi:hypothetical protein